MFFFKQTTQLADVSRSTATTTKKPNYFGNFHLTIRIPKDRNLDELQNLTLITATDSKNQNNLNQRLEQLQDSINKLTDQVYADQDKSHKKINVLDRSGLEAPNRQNKGSDLINLGNKNFDKNLRSKKMVCLKRPPTMSTFCYMV